MINCKFTKDELEIISMALKIAMVGDLDIIREKYNSILSLYYPKNQLDGMKIDDNRDMQNYIVSLRGNVKSLIRNN